MTIAQRELEILRVKTASDFSELNEELKQHSDEFCDYCCAQRHLSGWHLLSQFRRGDSACAELSRFGVGCALRSCPPSGETENTVVSYSA